MFYILYTEDVVTDGVYFSKHIGQLTDTVDPAKKFKQLKLEDGTKSVKTEVYKQFGTKLSMNSFYDTEIPESQKAEPVEEVIIEPKPIRPEVAIILDEAPQIEENEAIVDEEKADESTEIVEEDVISEPESVVKKTTPKKK